MPDGSDAIQIQVITSLKEVSAPAWDLCAGDNPFVRHGFLSAAEDSGSATMETGWLGQHLLLQDPELGLIGALPLYLKNHSYGEYVFDWGWADAYERAGGRYYPKLQAAVPFTPATGPRFLVHPDASAKAVRQALIAGLCELQQRHETVTAHVTFPQKDEWDDLGESGFLQRIGRQYHWHNRDYDSFDDFLATLTSRKRKSIRKERREVVESGIKLTALSGREVKERHWDAFYRFYRDTSDRKWGQAYLTREFFFLLGERMADQVVLVVAEDPYDNTVAAALNLRDDSTLYGRNWGCSADYKFLHFEACYYQALDYAIAHGLQQVEAGAQGEHKIQRGYEPVETYSAHRILDPGLKDAVAHFLTQEERQVQREIDQLTSWLPYKEGFLESNGKA
ncbi:GNAT family N-acetyltransferase [Rhodovibrionaceae bacterium A322]